ncbi:Beta-lactamase-like [Ceraceosorus bombacis]|uniref:Beta-lactamase-like n=1 Tax=Ceraceosorus bombacis TaxID=401625 RepID=A0A0P1B9Q0_9BASI|nr:Beta-lactamase-like [Ceraceosorus bombacis]
MSTPNRAGPSTLRQDPGDVAAPTSESLVHTPLIDPWIRKVVFLGTGTSGLDALRAWTMRGAIQHHVDVYCTKEAFEGVRNTFPYLIDESKATGSGSVGALRFHLIDPARPFEVDAGKGPIKDVSGKALLVEPLLVGHGLTSEGASFPCLGFRIGSLSYISDVSSIPRSTRSKLKGTRVLVIDSLSPRRHISHYSLAQAVEESLRVAALNADGGQDGRRLELALVTDLAHGLEHHATDHALLSFVAGLRVRHSQQHSRKRPDLSLSDAIAQEPISAGAKRAEERADEKVAEEMWWLQHWDSLTADDPLLNPDGLPRLRDEVPTPAQLESVSTQHAAVGWMMQTGSSKDQPYSTPQLSARNYVPDIRVSFDGLCICFGPESERSSRMTFASPMLGLSAGLTQGLANFLRPDGKLVVPKSSRAQAQGTESSLRRDQTPPVSGQAQTHLPQREVLTERPPLATRSTVRPSTAKSSDATPTLESSKKFVLAPLDQSEGERISFVDPAHLPFPASVSEAQQDARRSGHRKSKGPRRPAELAKDAIPARSASLSNPPSPSNSRSGSEAGSSRTTSDASYTVSEYSARSLGVGEQSVDSVKSASTSANSPPKRKGFADRIRSRVSSLASVRSRRQSSKSTSEHNDGQLSEHRRTESFSK